MQHRSNVSPVPLSVNRSDEAVAVTYLDGRRVTYHGPFTEREEEVRANQSFEVHVLVIDPTIAEGVMTYINDFDTSDAILESTGVGRVLLGDGEEEAIYPGIVASRSAEWLSVKIVSDPGEVWVYTFIENDRGESNILLKRPA